MNYTKYVKYANYANYAFKESIYLGISSVLYPLHYADLNHTEPLIGSEFLTHDNNKGFVNKQPILLIHGYMHNHSGWLYLKKHMINAGIGPIYTINFKGKFNKIQEFANQLSNKIDEIFEETQIDVVAEKKITLVGHSMGGIVAAFFAEFLDEHSIVDKIITIGSPLMGTKVADKIGIGDCAKSMQYESAFSKALHNAITENIHHIDYRHIYSAHDQMIIPQKSARIKTNKFYKLEHEGHISLLFSKEVSKILINSLGE